jgi:hypothetical protein
VCNVTCQADEAALSWPVLAQAAMLQLLFMIPVQNAHVGVLPFCCRKVMVVHHLHVDCAKLSSACAMLLGKLKETLYTKHGVVFEGCSPFAAFKDTQQPAVPAIANYRLLRQVMRQTKVGNAPPFASSGGTSITFLIWHVRA